MGRLPVDLGAEIVRAITPDDIQALLSEERHIQPPALKRLSERHHALARVLADGEVPGIAAIRCDYSLSRVSILLADPSFQNLIEYYRAGVERFRLTGYEQHEQLRNAAAAELLDRFEDDDERKRMRTDVVTDIWVKASDRTGHGPQSTSVSVSAKLGEDLDAAMREERVARRRALEPHIYGNQLAPPPASRSEPPASRPPEQTSFSRVIDAGTVPAEMTQMKKYKVARPFTDKSGKQWQAGQQYDGDEQEAQQQVSQGNLQEDTEGSQRQQRQQR